MRPVPASRLFCVRCVKWRLLPLSQPGAFWHLVRRDLSRSGRVAEAWLVPVVPAFRGRGCSALAVFMQPK